jgi:hypothetical protein
MCNPFHKPEESTTRSPQKLHTAHSNRPTWSYCHLDTAAAATAACFVHCARRRDFKHDHNGQTTDRLENRPTRSAADAINHDASSNKDRRRSAEPIRLPCKPLNHKYVNLLIMSLIACHVQRLDACYCIVLVL